MIGTTYRRVGVFHSTEVFEEKSPGEWDTVPAQSTTSVAELVNDFIATNKARLLFVSPPAIIQMGKADKKRVIRTSISIIYEPPEVISYGEKEGSQEKIVVGVEPAWQEPTREAIRQLGEKLGVKLRIDEEVEEKAGQTAEEATSTKAEKGAGKVPPDSRPGGGASVLPRAGNIPRTSG